jgi:hypothetical protein
MKYVIVCQKKGCIDWIAAILNSEKAATKYLLTIKLSIKTFVIPIEAKFPLYIIEDNGFVFTDDDDLVTDKIKAVKKDKKQKMGEAYFIYYYIKKSFAAPNGKDMMGSLDHVHVDNRFLESFKTIS